MKVLLTGASGFVGSHILDCLKARAVATAILLRSTSDRRFIQSHLSSVEVRQGSIDDPASLDAALAGVSHVIHCAGLTRARRAAEFYLVNRDGTRNVVNAVNARRHQVRRLLHVSSLAAVGPGTPAKPARDEDPPHPVSEYGKSKLAGEREVLTNCRVEYCILRPPAVYGPRDAGFLSLFQAVRAHLLPRPSARQALSLIYVTDLAQAVVTCLDHPAAAAKTYFAAAPEIFSARAMAAEIAKQMNRWTIPFPLPTAALWPVCLLQQTLAQLTGKASLLNLQKYAELRAPGWVCDASRIRQETGWETRATLSEGVARTLAWYREEGWV